MANYIEFPPPILSHDEQGHLCRTLPSGKTVRICGVGRRGMPVDYPCCRRAGLGTDHLGIGYCQSHDRGGLTRQRMSDLLTAAREVLPPESGLARSLETAKGFTSADLNSQDIYLKLISAMTLEYLDDSKVVDPNTGEVTFNLTDAKRSKLLGFAKAAREFQETKLKADQLKTFNPMLIPKLLQIIMIGISGLLMKKGVAPSIVDSCHEIITSAVTEVFSDGSLAQLGRDMQAASEAEFAVVVPTLDTFQSQAVVEVDAS